MIPEQDPAHDASGATASPAGRSVVVSDPAVPAPGTYPEALAKLRAFDPALLDRVSPEVAEDARGMLVQRVLDGPAIPRSQLARVAASNHYLVGATACALHELEIEEAAVAVVRAKRRNDRKAERAAERAKAKPASDPDWRRRPRGFKPGRAGLLAAIRRRPDGDPPTAA